MEATNQKQGKVIDPDSIRYGLIGQIVDIDDTYITLRFSNAQKPVCYLVSQVEVQECA